MRWARESRDELLHGDGSLTHATLRPISRGAYRRLANEMRVAMPWIDDDNCGFRATIGALHVLDRLPPNPKLPEAGVENALTGAVVVATAPRLAGKQWLYHAATVMQPEGAREPMVVDHLLFDRPVPLSRWQRRLRVDDGQVKITDPRVNPLMWARDVDRNERYDVVGRGAVYGFGEIKAVAAALGDAWRAAAKTGTYKAPLRVLGATG
jgi:hypothetical protein